MGGSYTGLDGASPAQMDSAYAALRHTGAFLTPDLQVKCSSGSGATEWCGKLQGCNRWGVCLIAVVQNLTCLSGHIVMI